MIFNKRVNNISLMLGHPICFEPHMRDSAGGHNTLPPNWPSFMYCNNPNIGTGRPEQTVQSQSKCHKMRCLIVVHMFCPYFKSLFGSSIGIIEFFAPIDVYLQRTDGWNTLGIRQQKHHCPWEFDRPPNNKDGIVAT